MATADILNQQTQTKSNIAVGTLVKKLMRPLASLRLTVSLLAMMDSYPSEAFAARPAPSVVDALEAALDVIGASPLDPKGARLDCTAHFDNSANNPNTPDPKEAVRWGDQTWEEMMIGFVDYYYDVPVKTAKK